MSGSAPKVSIVCAWYNRAGFIRDTIDSLLAQDHPDFEVIVIDDGSPDPRVAEILGSYADPRLRVIHQRNAGFTQAVKRAVEESTGAFIAVQGAGDVAMPNRLTVLSRGLEAHPHCIGVASARRNRTVGGARDGQCDEVRLPGPEISRAMLLGYDGSPISHGEVMFRRSAYDAAGGYRGAFRLAQDKDLWLRMCRAGPFLILDDVVYERRIFVEDGVKGSVAKTMAQKLYSTMAKQCALEFDRQGYDTVDLFGEDALLFRQPDAIAADFCAKAAMKYARAGLPEDARLLAGYAVRERARPLPLLALLLARMGAHEATRPLATWLIARLPIVDNTESPSILKRLKRRNPASAGSTDTSHAARG